MESDSMKTTIAKYQFQVSYVESESCFVATVAEFPYLSADGKTQAKALAELQSVVEAAVETLEAEGRTPPEPVRDREYKGNITLRLLPETHRQVSACARNAGCSLNQFLTSLIEKNMTADRIEQAVKELERVAGAAAGKKRKRVGTGE